MLKNQHGENNGAFFPKKFSTLFPSSFHPQRAVPKLFCSLQSFRMYCNFLLVISATPMQVTLLLKECSLSIKSEWCYDSSYLIWLKKLLFLRVTPFTAIGLVTFQFGNNCSGGTTWHPSIIIIQNISHHIISKISPSLTFKYETSKLYATLGRGSLQIGEVAGKKGQSNNIKMTNSEQPQCYKHNNWKGWRGGGRMINN